MWTTDFKRMPDPVIPAGSERNSGIVVETGANAGLRVWTADPAQAKKALCQRIGEQLTPEEWTRYLPGIERHSPC